MTKAEFFKMWTAMYRLGNLADTDSSENPLWTHVDMAGRACCAPLDDMTRNMVKCGVITDEERQALYDNL